MSILTIQNYQTSQTDNTQGFEAEEDSSEEGKNMAASLFTGSFAFILFSVSFNPILSFFPELEDNAQNKKMLTGICEYT